MDKSRNPENDRCRWWVTLTALAMPLVASFFYFVLFPGTRFGNGFFGGIKAFLLFWPVVATVFLLREPLRRIAPGPGDRTRSVLIGVVFGGLVAGLMFLLQEFTLFGEVVERSAGNIRQRVQDIGMIGHYVWFAVFVSLVHAWLEEFYWRWFVFGNLRRLIPVPAAHVAAGLGFALHHIVVTSQFFPLWFALLLGLFVGIGGMAWSWLYQRHRTLIGPWISHVIVDAAIFWIGYGLLFGGGS